MRNYFKVGILAALGAISFAPRAQAQLPQWGGVDDVPTLSVGDSWDYARDFQIKLYGRYSNGSINIFIDLNLNFTETFGLAVASVGPVVNAIPGFPSTQAYKRSRTHGALAASVSGRLELMVGTPTGAIFLPANLRPDFRILVSGSTQVSDTGTGENWLGVSDLAQIREKFTGSTTTGTLLLAGDGPNGNTNTICALLPSFIAGINCGGTLGLGLGVSLQLDHMMSGAGRTTGGLELVDFPTVTSRTADGVGEISTSAGVRRLDGTVHLEIAGLLNQDLAFTLPQSVDYISTLVDKNIADPNNVYTDCRFLAGSLTPTNDLVYFSPTAKEMPYWQIGDLAVPIAINPVYGTVTLKNFTTEILSTGGVSVSPAGTSFTNLAMSPARPAPGQSFVLSGTIGDITAVSVQAEVLLPNGAGSTSNDIVVGGLDQNFAITLTAPTNDDSSPMTPLSTDADLGSFGIKLTGGPVSGTKIVTVRLAAPTPLPPSAAGDWKFYE